MGFFDAMGGDLFGIGSIVNGLLGYQGQKKTNEANIEMARETNMFARENAIQQMNFQERMSNTAYQRAIKDMQASGLNPMLAYSQGGASAPSGASSAAQAPTIGNAIGAGTSSAIQAAGAVANLKNTNSQTSLNDAMAMKAGAETLATMNSAEGSRFEIDHMLGLRKKRFEFQTDVDERNAWEAAFDQDAMRDNPSGKRGGELGRRAAEADLNNRIYDSILNRAGIPKAEAEEKFYRGAGEYMPYVSGLGEIFSSALGLKNLMGGRGLRPQVRPYRGDSGKRGFRYESDKFDPFSWTPQKWGGH